MKQAGLVLDYAPELADQVIGGEVTLNEAATAAEQKRTEADRRERRAQALYAIRGQPGTRAPGGAAEADGAGAGQGRQTLRQVGAG